MKVGKISKWLSSLINPFHESKNIFKNIEAEHAYGATHTGRVRSNNEDAFKIHLNELYIVADGMGGHQAGEVASSKAVEYLSEFFTPELLSQMKENPDIILEKLKEAVEITHKRLYELSQSKPEYLGMGTTLVVTYINQDTLYSCHVGDSRVYVIDKDSITQITNDHSLVWKLYLDGQISKEEVRLSPLKNRITQAVGYSIIQPELNTYKLKDNDLILLCTDGLWDMLSDEEIFSIIREGGSLEDMVKKLIHRANETGGEDNITIILIRHKAK